MDQEGHLVGRDDITAQPTQTVENVKKAWLLLEQASRIW
jgi:hypothetical protein